MGLDMYLTGDKYKRTQYAKDENGEFLRDDDGGIIPINEDTVDGYRRSSQKLDLGYWRKHAPLHQLFVDAFADGEDNCRPIELSAEDLRWVANVLKGHAATSLPSNKKVIRGCFFGSEEYWDELREDAYEDAKVFEKAAEWLESDGDEYWHSVQYQASW